MSNLAELLMDHPFTDDQLLLHSPDRSIAAGAARAAATATAREISASGVRPGQAVAVRLPSSPESIIAMAGVWLAGCVFIPVNHRAPEQELARVDDLIGPAALIDADGLHPRDGASTYPEGTAFVLWTSGTTGAPKAILHTHEAYVELLDRVLGPLRGDTSAGPKRPPTPNLIPVSLALNAGIYNTLFGLRAGAPIVVMDRFETVTFAELVRRFGIRSTVLPPAAIAMLNDDAAVTDLSPLRYVRSITAPLSPLQARRFTAKFDAFVLNGYGQAEIGEVIGWTSADAKSHPEKVGAAGRPHPGVDIRIADDGRLWVRPPQRASGYAGGGALDDRVDADGYLDTGDMARVDEEGFVWIDGRAGDLINRGGNKVFPGDVEEVLRLSPDVTDAAVIGMPDDRLGEVPVALVTGGPLDPAALTALCREHLVAYKVPVAYHLVDALPKNEAGKLLRSELAQLIQVEQ